MVAHKRRVLVDSLAVLRPRDKIKGRKILALLRTAFLVMLIPAVKRIWGSFERNLRRRKRFREQFLGDVSPPNAGFTAFFLCGRKLDFPASRIASLPRRKRTEGNPRTGRWCRQRAGGGGGTNRADDGWLHAERAVNGESDLAWSGKSGSVSRGAHTHAGGGWWRHGATRFAPVPAGLPAQVAAS